MTAATHALIAVAVGSCIIPRQRLGFLLLVGAACAVIPDVDLLSPYLGGDRDFHRRFTHSLTFAVIIGLSCAAGAHRSFHDRLASMRLACYAAAATVSHALADMFTTYPLGVALLEPFSDARYQLPWRPVTSVTREFEFVFLPTVLVVVCVLWFRRALVPVRMPTTICRVPDADSRPGQQRARR